MTKMQKRLIAKLLYGLAIIVYFIGFFGVPWYRAGRYYSTPGYKDIFRFLSGIYDLNWFLQFLWEFIELPIGLLILLFSVLIKKGQVLTRILGSLFLTERLIAELFVYARGPVYYEFELVEFAYGFYIFATGIVVLWLSLIFWLYLDSKLYKITKKKIIKEFLIGFLIWFFVELTIFTFRPIVL